MTKKQFNVFDVDGTIFLEDHKEGSYHIGEIGNVDVNCLNDIADRLNELNDKNKFLSDFRSFITMEHQKIKKENEELKATLRTYRKVANCRNCDYHDYDSREDGDEFEVCDKGNDVTEGICEEWREL